MARQGVAPIVSGKGRVTEVEEYWLNEEQALLVSVLCKAPNAAPLANPLAREEKPSRVISTWDVFPSFGL